MSSLKKIPRNYGTKKKEPEEINILSGGEFDLNLDAKRREYINDNAIQVSAPQPQTKSGIAMDSSCASLNFNGSFDFVNRHILSYFLASGSFIGYYSMAIIAQNSLVQIGCSSASEDAMRNGYKLIKNCGGELSRDEQKKISKLDKRYKLDKNIIEGDTFNNVFGIRHILFRHTDPNFDYSKPFNADSFKGGKYAGIAQIEPYYLTPVLDDNDITDPSSIGYYEPTFWIINGKRYHKSHFVILMGDPVADYLKPTYRYGGLSMTQKVYERVYAAERTANEIPQLVMTKRMNVRKTDLVKAQANKQQFIQSLNAAQEFRDNYGVQVVDLKEQIEQIETSLADLDTSMWANYHLTSSIFRRPISKIFGTGHPGFSTGDTDDDYDNARLKSLQSGNLEDIAYAHYERMIPSELGNEMDLDIIWNPLKIMSEKEEADINYIKSQTAINLWTIGAIGDADERDRITKDKLSGYSGIKVLEEIEDKENNIEGQAQDGFKDGLNIGDYVEVESDRGNADNGPWTNKIVGRDSSGGLVFDEDGFLEVYEFKIENRIKTFKKEGITYHVFEK